MAPTFTVVDNSTWPGGNYLSITFGGAGGPGTGEAAGFTADAVPVVAGQVILFWITEALNFAAGSVGERKLYVEWFDSSFVPGQGMVPISTSVILDETLTGAYAKPMTGAFLGSAQTAPPAASWARLTYQVWEVSGHNAANYAYVGEMVMRSGQATFQTLIVTTTLEADGTVTLGKNAVVTLQAGVLPPVSAPTLSQGLAAPTTLEQTSDDGWSSTGHGYRDSAGGSGGATDCWVQMQDDGAGNFRVAEWNISDGTLNQTTAITGYSLGANPGFSGMTRIGTLWFAVGLDDTHSTVLTSITRSTGAVVGSTDITSRFYASSPYCYAICNDGTYVYCIGLATSYTTIRAVKFNTSRTYQSTTALTLTSAPSGKSFSNITSAVMVDIGDGNGTCFWLGADWSGPPLVTTYIQNSTAGALIANTDFYSALTGTKNGHGLWWTGTTMKEVYAAGASYSAVYTFTNWGHGSSSMVLWVGHTWYDSDATGGTHETTISPRATLTLLRRRQLTITTPSIPTGGTDDPDKCRIYVYQGASDPGATGFKLQATDALTSRTLTSYNAAGAADPATNNFVGGSGHVLDSADGVTFIRRGDGSGVDLGLTELRLPTAAPTTDKDIGWDDTIRSALVGDGTYSKPLNAGWCPYAYPIGLSATDAASSAVNLAASSGGNAGCILVPVFLPAPMRLYSLTIHGSDTASARAAEWDVAGDWLNSSTIYRITGSNGTFSFTPAAAGPQTSTCSTAGVLLPAGIVLVRIRNTSTARTFGLTVVALPLVNKNQQLYKADVAALGATLSTSGFAAGTARQVVLRLNGLTMGGAADW